MDFKMVALVAFVALFQLALSAPDPIDQVLDARWPLMDLNNNNIMERSELDHIIYSSYDINNDTKVSLSEYLVAFNTTGAALLESGRQIFKQIDVNEDGFWTDPDLAAFHTKMDIDHNGKVSKEEFKTTVKQILAKAHYVIIPPVVG